MKLSFLSLSEILQIIIGFLILKYFNGRRYKTLHLKFTQLCRIKINFFLVAICVPIEIAQVAVQAFSSEFSKPGQLTPNFWLNAVHGVFIYTLYYQVCILSSIDMAKVWLLRAN
jgi:hypothetical protein